MRSGKNSYLFRMNDDKRSRYVEIALKSLLKCKRAFLVWASCSRDFLNKRESKEEKEIPVLI